MSGINLNDYIGMYNKGECPVVLIGYTAEILSITKVEGWDFSFVLVDTSNSACSYTEEGRLNLGGECKLKLRPKKVKYLKPLHKILEENPGYRIEKDGCINGIGTYSLVPGMLSKLDNPAPVRSVFHYDDDWFEYKEE